MYPSSHLQIECGFLSFLCFMQYCVWGLCFRKKMYDDCDMDGSSSCLCCTLLKGNCLEGHQNLKGILYGVIKISLSINSVYICLFLPLSKEKRDAFAKVFMLNYYFIAIIVQICHEKSFSMCELLFFPVLESRNIVLRKGCASSRPQAENL